MLLLLPAQPAQHHTLAALHRTIVTSTASPASHTSRQQRAAGAAAVPTALPAWTKCTRWACCWWCWAAWRSRCRPASTRRSRAQPTRAPLQPLCLSRWAWLSAQPTWQSTPPACATACQRPRRCEVRRSVTAAACTDAFRDGSRAACISRAAAAAARRGSHASSRPLNRCSCAVVVLGGRPAGRVLRHRGDHLCREAGAPPPALGSGEAVLGFSGLCLPSTAAHSALSCFRACCCHCAWSVQGAGTIVAVFVCAQLLTSVALDLTGACGACQQLRALCQARSNQRIPAAAAWRCLVLPGAARARWLCTARAELAAPGWCGPYDHGRRAGA